MSAKQEAFDRLIKDLADFETEVSAKDEPSADDAEKLTKMTDDVAAFLNSIEAEQKAHSALDRARGLNGDAPDPLEVDGETGIVNPKGLTLGDALVKSPGYAEFLDQFKGADGKIMERASITKEVGYSPEGGSFHQKTALTGLSSTSAGALIEPYRYSQVADLVPFREMRVRDLCTNIQIESDLFEYVRVTSKTNAAAAVAEATTAADPGSYGDPASGAKPESAMALAVINAPVETIAHYIPITRRAAADASQVMGLVNQFLADGLAEEEEDQILLGDGSTPNLQGILDSGTGIGTVGSAGTDLDAIVDAIRTISLQKRRATALVIHPNDWYSTGFLLSKESGGPYLVANPAASTEQINMLWGLQVVVTEAISENTALVGDFRQAVVADRMQSQIFVTDSHKDWFQRNLLAVLAEERLSFGVLDPGAFCSVTAV